MIWNENERRGGGGGGGGGGGDWGLNRLLRSSEELSPINFHKYRWLLVVARTNLEKIMERRK